MILICVHTPLFCTSLSLSLALALVLALAFYISVLQGNNQIPQPALMSMIELFETRVEGLVNYSNFVEFVRECGVSFAVDALTKKLHR